MSNAQAHAKAVSFRLDQDLKPTVESWLHQHPSLTLSRLANMAIRQFVSHDQQLEKVEVVNVSESKFKTSLKKMMKKHSDMLDKLK